MKSVAMAFYNGAKYIDEQIRSILDNMEETDELIISVDDASDGSEAVSYTHLTLPTNSRV